MPRTAPSSSRRADAVYLRMLFLSRSSIEAPDSGLGTPAISVNRQPYAAVFLASSAGMRCRLLGLISSASFLPLPGSFSCYLSPPP